MEKDLKKLYKVFPGFEIELVASGFNLPVNLAFVPEPGEGPKAPLLYVAELYGSIKVVTNDWSVYTYVENLLNYEPDFRIPGSGESGLIGICFEPETGDLFVSMIYEDGQGIKARVVRTSSKDGLKMESSTTVIDDIPSVQAAHQIQAVSIGFDGRLYVNVGDGMLDPGVAQKDKDLRGKILRLELDGSIPEDNPDSQSYVYAKGFRNPFGAAWRKSDGSLYISDNGPEVDDRIARVEGGKNYGWPESMRRNSLFWWHFTQAPTAMDFMQNREFPGEFHDELFVALFGAAYVEGWSNKGKKIVKLRLSEDGKAVKSYDEFVTYIGKGLASPCGLAFGPGGLYFTDLHGEEGDLKAPSGNIYRVKPREEEGRIPDVKENLQRCICLGCPSYTGCMREEGPQLLFCARGMSGCEIERKGCICGECPIANEYNIAGFYYCKQGAARKGGGYEQKKMEGIMAMR